MKASYDPTGEATDQEVVDVVAWDGDKYFTFRNSLGEIYSDKRWKFDVKRSNKIYKLPRGYLEDVDYPNNKEVSEELKLLRKRRVEYTAVVGDTRKDFKHLHKALNFCKSNPACTFLKGSFFSKGSSLFTPVLVKEGDGFWYYYPSRGNVSSKTLDRWVMSI